MVKRQCEQCTDWRDMCSNTCSCSAFAPVRHLPIAPRAAHLYAETYLCELRTINTILSCTAWNGIQTASESGRIYLWFRMGNWKTEPDCQRAMSLWLGMWQWCASVVSHRFCQRPDISDYSNDDRYCSMKPSRLFSIRCFKSIYSISNERFFIGFSVLFFPLHLHPFGIAGITIDLICSERPNHIPSEWKSLFWLRISLVSLSRSIWCYGEFDLWIFNSTPLISFGFAVAAQGLRKLLFSQHWARAIGDN